MPNKSIFRRAWFWILTGLVSFGISLILILPVGIDYGIEAYLEDQGADQASLEDVDFNPFTGRMTLTNLSISIGSQTVLQIPEVTLNIQWAPFIRKRFVLKRFTISDTDIVVEELKDGSWQIGGITIPPQNTTDESASWGFSFREATAKNCKVKLISSKLKSDLAIEQAKLSKLNSWSYDDNARLELTGKLNNAPLQLQLDVSPFSSEILASGRIKLTGLDLKPFTQLLQPHLKTLEGRLDIDASIETRHTADSGGISHYQKGPVKLHQVHAQIADINLSKNDLAWDGGIRVNFPASEKEVKVSTEGQLTGSGLLLNIENENLKIQQDNLSWKGKINYVKDNTNQKINTDGQISLVDFQLESPQLNIAEEKLTWQGALEFSSNPNNERQKIIADGRLDGAGLAMTIPNKNIKLQQEQFGWQGKIDYVQDKITQNIKTDGQISLVDLKMESPQLNLTEEELNWQGPLQLSSTADTGIQGVTADGVLAGSHLQMSLPGRKLKLKHQGLSWKGRLDSGETNDFASLQTAADATFKDVEILHSETHQHLLGANQFDLQAIKVDSLSTVSVSGIVLNGLALLAEPKAAPSSEADPSPLRIQEVKFDNVRLSQQKDLAIDAVQLTGVKGFLHRDRKGKWTAIDQLASMRSDIPPDDQTQRATSDTSVKEKSDEFGLRIRQVDISGDSGLQFKDDSVSPAFDMNLSILKARLVDLDSSRPEQPASLELLISDKENARLSLNGTLQPFAEKLSLNWVGKIEALELPTFSPYVIQNTGYRFTSGELEADIPLKIAQNELDGQIELILYNPRIKRAKAEIYGEEQRGKIRLNMTLDSALRMLRDEQNNVKLNIPISGNINDPQFSVADAINQVLARTLQKSAISTLKYMLGPYGIGISIAELAYDQATKIRLNPIMFAPGSDELDEVATDYLKRVAAVMKEYPMARLRVCGVATESDRATINQNTSTDAALLALAKNRAESIEDRLVQLNSIDSKRIIACEPDIDKAAEAKPRADLEI
ncbi:MAG: DUF748 domain-containing protein [Desulfobacterales bacterium]